MTRGILESFKSEVDVYSHHKTKENEMKITVLIHQNSWFTYNDAVAFMPVLTKYADPNDIAFSPKPEKQGDVLFALHYPALIPTQLFSLHKYNIVIHGADLPSGRGRSPIHWQVEEGCNEIPLTMFEMGDGPDNGPIYFKHTLKLDGTELLPYIRLKILKTELDMIDIFLSKWPMTPQEQQGEPSYYKKRARENQELDPNKTIADQFDKMRVADNEQYPLWFEHRGVTYEIKIYSKAPRPKLFKRDISPEPPFDFTG
jgi:methionyl-tRNA formyltransferase